MTDKKQLSLDDAAPASVPDSEAIRQLLRQVIDPELAINIIDLGLVYRIEPSPERVLIEMTMTSPACPMGQMIIDDATAVLEAAVPAGCRVEIVLVWNPPWGPELMSERSRLTLGWTPE